MVNRSLSKALNAINNKLDKAVFWSNYEPAVSLLILVLLINGTSFGQQKSDLGEHNDTFKYMKNEAQRKNESDGSNRRDWLYTGMEVSYISLNIADLVTTYYSLTNGAREANPITKLYIHNRPLTIVIKGSLTAGVLYGLRQIKKEHQTAAYLTLGVLNILYGFVVNNNVGVYLEIKK
jgi:hypothetical protein